MVGLSDHPQIVQFSLSKASLNIRCDILTCEPTVKKNSAILYSAWGPAGQYGTQQTDCAYKNGTVPPDRTPLMHGSARHVP